MGPVAEAEGEGVEDEVRSTSAMVRPTRIRRSARRPAGFGMQAWRLAF